MCKRCQIYFIGLKKTCLGVLKEESTNKSHCDDNYSAPFACRSLRFCITYHGNVVFLNSINNSQHFNKKECKVCSYDVLTVLALTTTDVS